MGGPEQPPVPVPEALLEGFPDVERAQIERWWAGLTPETQVQMDGLCREHSDSCVFATLDHPKLMEHGRFLPDEESGPDDDGWEQDYFDYLVNHPMLVIAWDGQGKRFHVGCVAHPHARACWSRGQVPADFACPFQREACLMAPLRGRRWTVTPRRA